MPTLIQGKSLENLDKIAACRAKAGLPLSSIPNRKSMSGLLRLGYVEKIEPKAEVTYRVTNEGKEALKLGKNPPPKRGPGRPRKDGSAPQAKEKKHKEKKPKEEVENKAEEMTEKAPAFPTKPQV